ncbi:MAG: GtrA family protein [Chitinophagales bacterium]|nr:GtrA family protein [Chitinophagales bacterium]
MSRWKIPEFGKFISVGALNTLIGLLVIYAAKWIFCLDDISANATGYAVGFILSFVLNSRWTFAYHGKKIAALGKFVLVALVAYGINLIFVMLAIGYFDMNGYLAQIFGIPPYTLASYFLSKYLVFRTDSVLGRN